MQIEQEVKEAQLSQEDMIVMKTWCQDFLIEANAQLEERMTETLDIISCVNHFNPRECLSHFRKEFRDLPVRFFDIHNCDSHKLANQYRKRLLVNWKNEFKDNIIPDDPIAFWSGMRKYKNALEENWFEELATVALSAYCLPMSNAVEERIFSHATNVKNKLRNKLSPELLSAIIRVKSKLHFNGKCCKDFIVTRKMLSLFNYSMYGSTTLQPVPSAQDDLSKEEFDDIIAVQF